METKSRFEVLKELNDKKESLLREKEALDDFVLAKKKQIKERKRQIEDMEEELADYENRVPEKKKYIDELIKTTDASIDSLQKINANK